MLEKKCSKGLKMSPELEKLVDEIAFEMITHKVPCVSSNLVPIYDFELVIKIKNIEACLELDSKFTEKIGIKLLDLAEVINKVNPDYESKEIYFIIEKMIDLDLPVFSLYNKLTLH